MQTYKPPISYNLIMTQEGNSFNHTKGMTADKIAIVGEIEHARRHCLRSAVVSGQEEDGESAFKFLVWAKQLQNMRRKYMARWFPNIDTKHWCLCKSAACLRQLSYELGNEGDLLREIDTIVDEIWESATGEDLSDCAACKEDQKTPE